MDNSTAIKILEILKFYMPLKLTKIAEQQTNIWQHCVTHSVPPLQFIILLKSSFFFIKPQSLINIVVKERYVIYIKRTLIFNPSI
jgi:hypothetical protein